MKSWNYHPISTCKNKTPVRMFYEGLQKLENGEELQNKFLVNL
jgi:hypothetical protein